MSQQSPVDDRPESRWATPTRRRLITVLVMAGLLAPAVADRDSFPLSTYPMYAQSRGAVVAVPTANGLTQAGEELSLSLQIIGDSDDPLIVSALLTDAAAGSSQRSDELCHQIAARAQGAGIAAVQIELATETHDVVEHTTGGPSLVTRTVFAQCSVKP